MLARIGLAHSAFATFFFLGLMGITAIVSPVLPLTVQSALLAISLTLKSVILFLLPFIIFGLLFKVTVQLANQATRTILLIVAAVCASNFLSTFISRTVGTIIYQMDLSVLTPQSLIELQPMWSVALPAWIPNDKAMLAAIVLGYVASRWNVTRATQAAQQLEKIVNIILQKFTYIIPIFIVGFVVKLSHDGAIRMIVQDYARVFGCIALSLFSYIVLLYWVASGGRRQKCMECLRNMLPAGLAGFSTMSSASAMPFTLIGTQKNARDKSLASSIIPLTVNIHLIGDCFAIPILAFAILKSFGLPAPTLLDYSIFAGYFVLAKFSVAAVPGGGIIVMLPILEHYLGFNASMLSLITALYILFDPVITSGNVLGNGGFALLIDKLAVRKERRVAPLL